MNAVIDSRPRDLMAYFVAEYTHASQKDNAKESGL